MITSIALITPPAEEPITPSDVIEISSIDEDLAANDITMAYISTLITSARQSAETITKRVFITQTWELYLDMFPTWEIELPFPPVQSITSIKYIDNDGVLQTMSSGDYTADMKSEPAYITPVYGGSWPSARYQRNAVTIRFVAGYGLADDVPGGIKTWMHMRVKTLYDNRDKFVLGTSFSQIDTSYIDGILDPFRVRIA